MSLKNDFETKDSFATTTLILLDVSISSMRVMLPDSWEYEVTR
jgi:hypothetical protein